MIFKTVWIVTYLKDDGEPIVTAFDNEEAATECFKYFCSRHITYIDQAPVYHNFEVIGEEG